MYAKLTENIIEYPQKNKGSILNYDLDIEQLIQDGYKEFHEVERPITNRQYHIEYAENQTQISEILVYDETQEEADERELNQVKEIKFNENTDLANQHLGHEIKIPVTDEQIECVFIYNDKTERNLNSASIMIIAGVIEKKQWTDEQGITVQLSAEDIANIGTRFNIHADKIWELWGEYKEQIEACTTIEEVNAINLNYEINI